MDETEEELKVKIKQKQEDKEELFYVKNCEIYWEKNTKLLLKNFEDEDDLKYILKIWKILNWYKDDFVVWIINKKKKNTYNLENILLTFSFFHTKWIKWFYNYQIEEIFEIIINLKKDTNRINFINENFINSKKIKNPEIFKQAILKYLETWDKKIITIYIKENSNKIDIVANNDLDSFIVNIVKNGSDNKKKKLARELFKIINIIIENFDAGILSSTMNKSSWQWTGRATNLFRQYLIRPLLKQQTESYINYINRIHIINWKEIINSRKAEDSWRKKTSNAQDSVADINYLFFEALENFKGALINYEKINNWNVEISNLLNTFSNILNTSVKKFKKENSIK